MIRESKTRVIRVVKLRTPEPTKIIVVVQYCRPILDDRFILSQLRSALNCCRTMMKCRGNDCIVVKTTKECDELDKFLNTPR